MQIAIHMRYFLFSIVCVLATFTGFAQRADDILGTWLTEKKDAHVQIFKSGSRYFGKLIWMKEPYQSDGKSLKMDKENPEPSLRRRPLLHLVFLSEFVFEDGTWKDGKIYDPESGKTYKAKMKLNGNVLDLRGFVGFSALGRTSSWTRVSR